MQLFCRLKFYGFVDWLGHGYMALLWGNREIRKKQASSRSRVRHNKVQLVRVRHNKVQLIIRTKKLLDED